MSLSNTERLQPVLVTSQASGEVPEGVSAVVFALSFPVAYVMGHGAVAGMQRSLMQRRLLSCDGESGELGGDVVSNPLQLCVGSDAQCYARGSVVGGIALCAFAFLVLASMSLFLTRRGKAPPASLWTRLARLRLPGLWLCFPALFLAPGVLMSSVVLLRRLSGGGGDVALGLLGVAVVLGALTVAAYVSIPLLGLAAEAVQTREPEGGRHWAEQLIDRGYVWVDRGSRGRGFVGHWGAVFEGMRGRNYAWYGVLEQVLGAASGIIAAASTDIVCEGLTALQLSLNVLQLIVLCAVRPYLSPMDTAAAIASAFLGVIWGIAAVVEGGDDVAVIVSDLQLWTPIVFLGMTLIPALLDPRWRHTLVNRIRDHKDTIWRPESDNMHSASLGILKESHGHRTIRRAFQRRKNGTENCLQPMMKTDPLWRPESDIQVYNMDVIEGKKNVPVLVRPMGSSTVVSSRMLQEWLRRPPKDAMEQQARLQGLLLLAIETRIQRQHPSTLS